MCIGPSGLLNEFDDGDMAWPAQHSTGQCALDQAMPKINCSDVAQCTFFLFCSLLVCLVFLHVIISLSLCYWFFLVDLFYAE